MRILPSMPGTANKRGFYSHPLALVESRAIGAGTRIWAFAHVMKGARIGRDCNIGDHVFIESGARLGNGVTVKNGAQIWEGVTVEDHAFIGPGAVFTNDPLPRSPRFPTVANRYRTKGWLKSTRVGRGATIGANATILCGLRIGPFAMVGAGAVVTRDVPTHALVAGCPATVRGHVCACGRRLVFQNDLARCGGCGKRYRQRGGQVAPIP